jgi:outer membrane receptor protein involved in Fe transport
VGPLRAFALVCILPAALAQVESLDPLTVSATRQPEPRSQVPFTVEIVPGDAFSDGVSQTPDDALRAFPDFSLFRRNDSITANPTTQGVSLRGLGPSGASRSLVLLDGVPLNDPFGGWVPWSLVPVDSIAAAEIVPGGGASVWGNDALAGVVQLFTAQPAAGTGDMDGRWGSFETRSADLSVAESVGPGTLVLRGQDFATDGTVLVAPGNRGPVDIDAGSRHTSASARWLGTLGGVDAAFTVRNFAEWRDNGTPYQQNQSHQAFGSAVFTGHVAAGETWNLTAYVQDQGFSQTFSSVNAARTAETPASEQFAVPTTAVGFAASSAWKDSTGATTTAGADFRNIRGETREDFGYSNGAFTEQRLAGGAQTFAGLFLQRTQPLGPNVNAMAGLRLDHWENDDGHRYETNISSGAVLLAETFPDRSSFEFSPSAGATWRIADGFDVHVAGQEGFREPTLNELYRPFRVGSTITQANPGLSTEHADTGEMGATWNRGHLRVTLEGFAARLHNAVDNVTLAQGPGTFPLFGTLPAGGVGQQRLNLDRVDTEGFQFGASWKESDAWSVDFSLIDEEAVVAAASVAPQLVGKTLAEVPRWNAALGLTWHPQRRLYFDARVRSTASDFDDDLNQLPLAGATVADVALRIQVSPHAEIFVGVDNLNDAQVETAHSAAGVYNIAPSRMSSVGARASW